LHARHVAFDVLEFGNAAAPRPLDLETEAYDRIVCSLVLPYVRNPDETVSEFVRALRPGGTVVVSTMKPDVDMSQLQAELVSEAASKAAVAADRRGSELALDEIRAYSGAAAFLLRLTQEGTFRFLTAAALSELLAGAGLVDIRLRSALGQPPQAYIASGRKP
jgi:2-polyprenyl-3-methyl-5-hydroxy-6-metoxy-1,4-benzoquinol methylase